jgi:hypothetical protein
MATMVLAEMAAAVRVRFLDTVLLVSRNGIGTQCRGSVRTPGDLREDSWCRPVHPILVAEVTGE